MADKLIENTSEHCKPERPGPGRKRKQPQDTQALNPSTVPAKRPRTGTSAKKSTSLVNGSPNPQLKKKANNDKFGSPTGAEVYDKVSRLAPGCSLSQSNDDDDVLKALADVVCQVQAKFRDHNPKLQEENATLKEEKAKLEEQKAELEGEKAELEGRKAKLQEQNATLKEEKAKLEEKKAELQEQNATLKEEKAKLEEKKAELEGEKAKLEEEKRKKEVKFRGIRDLLSEEP